MTCGHDGNTINIVQGLLLLLYYCQETKLRLIIEYSYGYTTQVFISASGSGRPCPCEPQTQLWTLKTEGHTRTVKLLKVQNKQSLILLVSGNYCILK